ncbi:MAG: DNA polymerase III subunit alpha [Gammaproteobacteria bacterium]|jgi:DNA polymerase III subunit alpha|nr:DNA polymerase III subunit alpha [Gammaproteobacteria bacterium]MBT5761531.1 DNA polymerase III subunit alpha [Gammaproteobacteria bacterium]MBT7932806.1 DNA polymerase III subunit alpha [Gammaproteobacteria bacterium]
MTSNFTHLHLLTSYSLSCSTINIDKLIKVAKKNKITALAITDHLNVFAAIKFYQKCIDNKIKPIIGCQIPVKYDTEGRLTPNIIVLCKNIDGYKNLIKLLSEIHVKKEQNKSAAADISQLKKYNDGLIILSGGRNGIVGSNLFSEENTSKICFVKELREIFSDRIYIQIDRRNDQSEKLFNNKLLMIAEELGLPLVATNHVLFLEKTDFDAHEVRVCINKKIKIDDRVNQSEFSDEQYFKTENEFKILFEDIPDAIENISEIVKKCNIHINTKGYHLPLFNTPDNSNVDIYFDNVVERGLQEILENNPDLNISEYKDRLKHEIKVIKEMGFVSYFLIVQEFIDWAKKNLIPVGPGRGSGAGSLVAFAMKITSIDPIKYNLLFERFLNVERMSMPDFDIDFCMISRQKIIEHITNLYGESKVSQIITYGTLSARAVIRDVGRVLGMGYTFVDRIAKLIPFSVGITIDDALKQNKELKKEYQNNEEIKNLIDTSKKLEGLPRNVGKHAAGIVVAPGDIDNFIPLYRVEESDEIVTQYDKDDIEKLGLVKFDILGLRTLSIIDRATKTIIENHGKIKNDSYIGLDDSKVFDLLQQKLTTGVFQLESSGMKRYMGRLKPDCFDDIVAIVALYRPGPLGTGMVDDFINNKHGKKINYEHSLLEPILSETYGLILYQEQVMEISRSLANYTLGEADLLRRAMGKKKKEEMEMHRKKFIDGAILKGINPNIASSIFSKMEKFAGYGFNKSHSVAYASISYQCAFLKTYYTSEFLSAALSSDMDNTDKVISLIDACEEMSITVLQPNINQSAFNFTSLNKNSILYGLGAIKGVGANAVNHISEERLTNGNFKSIFDFCERISLNTVNIGTIDALIYSGSFDVFKENRLTMKNSLHKAMLYGQQKQNSKNTGQQELFENKSESFLVSQEDDIDSSLKINDTINNRLKSLSLEKKVIGFYLSGHPIKEYQDEITSMSIKSIEYYFNQLYSIETDDDYSEHGTVSGVITNIRSQRMGQDQFINILTIDDSTHRLEIILFSDVYEKYRNLIKENEVLFFSGVIAVDDYNGDLSMKATKVIDMDSARLKFSKEIELFISPEHINDNVLDKIVSILEPHKNGKCPLTIKCLSNQHIVPLNLDNQWLINPSSNLINGLSDLLGKENIIVKYQ